jgi:thiol-disulfide isomerase/thioredoxin
MAGKKTSKAEQKRLAAQAQARKARRQWILVIGAGVLIIGGVLGVAIWQGLPKDGDTSVAAWDLPVRDNDPDGDGRITLAEFRGKPVVLNFYADWCIECERELPAFSSVSNELRDEIHFVHVNSQESGDWHRLVDDFGTNWWPIARDINGVQGGGSGLFDSLGGRGMPITAFYDAQGRLTGTINGSTNEAALRAQIAADFGIT